MHQLQLHVLTEILNAKGPTHVKYLMHIFQKIPKCCESLRAAPFGFQHSPYVFYMMSVVLACGEVIYKIHQFWTQPVMLCEWRGIKEIIKENPLTNVNFQIHCILF